MNTSTHHPPDTAAQHWDAIYQADPGHTGSWFQSGPEVSLRMLNAADVGPADSVVDVGGGESRLVDRLVERGFRDLSVLDVSAAALQTTRHRLGSTAPRVQWLVQDVLTWQPTRRYDVWHDRAVFHFLTTDSARASYRSVLETAMNPGGHVVIGTFAADGPEQCSRLPVARYSPEALAAQFDNRFRVLTTEREDHHTPAGTVQPFTWIALTKKEPAPHG